MKHIEKLLTLPVIYILALIAGVASPLLRPLVNQMVLDQMRSALWDQEEETDDDEESESLPQMAETNTYMDEYGAAPNDTSNVTLPYRMTDEGDVPANGASHQPTSHVDLQDPANTE